MFKLKEEFQTVEQHIDHVIKEAENEFKKMNQDVGERFCDLRAYIEGEFSKIYSRIDTAEQRIKALENNVADRLSTVVERVLRVERKQESASLSATPVNTPPVLRQENSAQIPQASTEQSDSGDGSAAI